MPEKIIRILVFVLGIPAAIIAGYFLIGSKQYYIVCAAILIMAFIPFFYSLDRKKLSAREIVTIASLIAVCVASRAAFYALPQVKPVCAIAMIAAISFGPDIGFIIGALSMLLSNFIFGQGFHTPFQMFGMGAAALICGLLFYQKKYNKNRIAVAIAGGLICFTVYGLIVDSGSVLMMSSDFNMGSIIAIFSSGLIFNFIHALSTLLILLLAGPLFKEKLERIQIKYELFPYTKLK